MLFLISFIYLSWQGHTCAMVCMGACRSQFFHFVTWFLGGDQTQVLKLASKGLNLPSHSIHLPLDTFPGLIWLALLCSLYSWWNEDQKWIMTKSHSKVQAMLCFKLPSPILNKSGAYRSWPQSLVHCLFLQMKCYGDRSKSISLLMNDAHLHTATELCKCGRDQTPPSQKVYYLTLDRKDLPSLEQRARKQLCPSPPPSLSLSVKISDLRSNRAVT